MSSHHQLACELTEKLNLQQKVQLLTGRDFWNTHGIDSIGLRNMLLSDGPSGVRGEYWDERETSLNLPSATAISSSWDTELCEELGSVLADEAIRKGVDVVLGPTINLHRSPFGGRHFECLSEDPLLTGALAAAIVRGIQAENIASCPKHYIANDFETNRFTANVQVAERTLRELYMRPFEDAVTHGKAWAIMSSYNSVNGTRASESTLLDAPLRTEWGFDGVVLSDWGAVRSVEAANAEQDLAMPGPHGAWGEKLIEAVRAGVVSELAVDRKVQRLLVLAMRVGALDSSGTTPRAKERTNKLVSVAGKAFARRAAAAGSVLLKNDGTLPLDLTRFNKVALIGDNAKAARTQGGGSATVIPDVVITPYSALASLLGERMRYEPGVFVQEGIEPIALELLTNPVTGSSGVNVEFLDETNAMIYEEHRLASQLMWLGSDAPLPRASSMHVRTIFKASETVSRLFGYASSFPVEIRVNRELHMSDHVHSTSEDPFISIMEPPFSSRSFDFVAGKNYEIDITVDLSNRAGLAREAMQFAFGFAPDSSNSEKYFNSAIDAAKEAELAIVVVGTNSKVETEGRDRTSLALPGDQDRLVREVLKVNRNVIVVVNSGSPVLLPWADEVRALLVCYFGGQEMGNALVDILSGAQEPGGRLPTTWAESVADLPVSSCTPDENNELAYQEGLHIGYRAFQRAGVTPKYPFGFGLGYTTWELGDLFAPERIKAGQSIAVSVTLRNTGDRPGKQVVQLYLSRADSQIDRPAIWLAGFSPQWLEPGEERLVEISINGREFAHWQEAWQFEAGEFVLHAGFHSQSLTQKASVVLENE